MTKCEYCGQEWGNRETAPGSGVYVGGVHWCTPMMAVMKAKDEIARIKREADPVWQVEQKRKSEEAAENHRKLIEALSALPGSTTTPLENHYYEPCSYQPCMYCKHREYDSWHDEMWCGVGKEKRPVNLPERLIIGEWGSCNSWEKADWV